MIKVYEIPEGFYNLTKTLDLYNEENFEPKKAKKQLGNFFKTQTVKNLIHREFEKTKTPPVCVYINKRVVGTYVNKVIYDAFIRWISKTDTTALYRKELYFAELLINTFKGVLEIKQQYPVCNYLVDFYIPKLNLVIEYDENYHKYTIDKDLIREKEIISNLNCEFIRVKETDKYELILNKIIKMIML